MTIDTPTKSEAREQVVIGEVTTAPAGTIAPGLPRLGIVLAGGIGLMLAAFALWTLAQPEPSGGVLLSDGQGTVALVDPTSGEEVFTLDGALASPDGSTIYRVIESAASASIQLVDPSDGSVQSEQHVPPRQFVRMVGVNGNAAVLMPGRPSHEALYAPTGKEVTDLTVVWKDGRTPKTFHLEGNFEPETFTLDGTRLYLLEFAPPTEPDHYFVRQLDLETGQVTDVYSPEVELNPEMRGHARAQAIHPDGTYMYTLYTVGTGEPVTDGTGEARYAFVHVISLEKDWSFCIFLPVPIGQKESGMGLSMDPDGKHLYVVDSVAQIVAEIHPKEFTVTRTASLEGKLGNPSSRTPIAGSTSAGNLFVASGSIVLAVDVDTLEPELAWSTGYSDAVVRDLRISADARELWVMTRAGTSTEVHVVDIATKQVVRRITSPLGNEASFVYVNGFGGKFDELGKFFCAC